MAFGTQGLEICTSMRAKEALPIGSAFVARLGTHVTEVRFGAKQNEGQKIWQVEEDDPDAATLIHAHLAMPFCYWIISHNHNFLEGQGMGDKLFIMAEHPTWGNVAAFEVTQPLPAIPEGTLVTQNGRRGTVLYTVTAGEKACGPPALPCVLSWGLTLRAAQSLRAAQ